MKRRVLIVNKFYYNRGGDCVAAMNLEKLLKANGYEVAFYAMSYPENKHSDDTEYFASQVEFGGGIKNKLNAAMRIFGLGDIKASFSKMLNQFKPDIVHLQNIHSYISPVVAEMAKAHGCKVVWTLHDYKLLCPSYSCLRDGLPCELCFTDKTNVLKYKCMKGSLAASALGYLEAKAWNRGKLERYTDAFVCPSQFMASKMAQGGFTKEKLNVVCNFVDPVKLDKFKNTALSAREDYYCYVGRLSEEKGSASMIEAASQLPYELRIAGDGPLLDELKAKYAHCPNIKFLGRLNAQEVSDLLNKAKLSVMPSECYDNNPLGVIESLCAGTPVVGAHIGGIPELITDGSGLTFMPKDIESLKRTITDAMSRDWDYQAIKNSAIEKFSPSTHLKLMQEIYNS